MAVILTGWVYVLDSGLGYYKIGKAKDLNRRVKQLKIQLPFPVTIQYAYQSSEHDYEERFWHEYYAAKRLNGEWFTLTSDDLAVIYEHSEYTGLYEINGEMHFDPLRVISRRIPHLQPSEQSNQSSFFISLDEADEIIGVTDAEYIQMMDEIAEAKHDAEMERLQEDERYSFWLAEQEALEARINEMYIESEDEDCPISERQERELDEDDYDEDEEFTAADVSFIVERRQELADKFKAQLMAMEAAR